jgi:hypothetical protein
VLKDAVLKDDVACLEIHRTELTASETKLTRVNDQAIRRVLEAAGVEFIDEKGGGPGVRLRGQRQSSTEARNGTTREEKLAAFV